VLILRIRQAETALKDGRLDEAYELARDEQLRAHHDGQKLVGRLVRALLARGQEHLIASRLTEAMTDSEKAERLGGNLPETAALRAAVTEALLTVQQAERQKAGLAAAARQHIRNGWLSMGEQALAELGPGATHPLQAELAARRATAEAAIARAQQALDRDDWSAAIEALREARQAHTSNPRTSELMDRAALLVVAQTGLAIDRGRLDLAESMLERMGSLMNPTLPMQELNRLVSEVRTAAAAIERGQPRQAAEILHRLRAARPSAVWLSEASKHAEQAAEGIEHLRRGPLGWITTAPQLEAEGAAAPLSPRPAFASPVNGSDNYTVNDPITARFLLHVDAVGSFLVLRSPRITIGPVSSSRRPDIALLAEAGLPVITIERRDEDYFLSSEVPIKVNDTPVTRKLLANDDRIHLGPRCQLKFTLPSAASTSAILHVSGSRLPTGDVQRVILMDKSIVLGPGSSAHIRADQMPAPAVLYIRDGRLLVRGGDRIRVNDEPMDERIGIPLGANACIGPVSMAVRPVEAKMQS
jgi:hypothetical protein